jgi:hypothetical protein
MGGINPYMIPAQYMPEDTYVSQHVPLPLEALDKALGKREEEVKLAREEALKAADVPLYSLDPDAEMMEEAKKYYRNKAEELAGMYTMEATLGGGAGLKAADKEKTLMFNELRRRLDKESGDLGSAMANYDTRQAWAKKIKEDHPDWNPTQIASFLNEMDAAYTRQKGIGKEDSTGRFQGYSTRDLAKYVDITEFQNTLAKEMEATVSEEGGIWQLAKDYNLPPETLNDLQQIWRKDGRVTKRLEKATINAAMQKAMMQDEAVSGYLSDLARINSYDTDEYGNLAGSKEAYQKAFNDLIAGKGSVMGDIHKKYDSQVDSDIKIKEPSKHAIDMVTGTGDYEPTVVIEAQDDAITVPNSNLMAGDEKFDVEDPLQSQANLQKSVDESFALVNAEIQTALGENYSNADITTAYQRGIGLGKNEDGSPKWSADKVADFYNKKVKPLNMKQDIIWQHKKQAEAHAIEALGGEDGKTMKAYSGEDLDERANTDMQNIAAKVGTTQEELEEFFETYLGENTNLDKLLEEMKTGKPSRLGLGVMKNIDYKKFPFARKLRDLYKDGDSKDPWGLKLNIEKLEDIFNDRAKAKRLYEEQIGEYYKGKEDVTTNGKSYNTIPLWKIDKKGNRVPFKINNKELKGTQIVDAVGDYVNEQPQFMFNKNLQWTTGEGDAITDIETYLEQNNMEGWDVKGLPFYSSNGYEGGEGWTIRYTFTDPKTKKKAYSQARAPFDAIRPRIEGKDLTDLPEYKWSVKVGAFKQRFISTGLDKYVDGINKLEDFNGNSITFVKNAKGGVEAIAGSTRYSEEQTDTILYTLAKDNKL